MKNESVDTMQHADLETHLIEVIKQMSEDEKRTLYRLLAAKNHIDQREHPRKMCAIKSDLQTPAGDYIDFIHNLSAGGAFIETSESFSVGQPIGLTFNLPNYPEAIHLTGVIVRTTSDGIGVQFKWPFEES